MHNVYMQYVHNTYKILCNAYFTVSSYPNKVLYQLLTISIQPLFCLISFLSFYLSIYRENVLEGEREREREREKQESNILGSHLFLYQFQKFTASIQLSIKVLCGNKIYIRKDFFMVPVTEAWQFFLKRKKSLSNCPCRIVPAKTSTHKDLDEGQRKNVHRALFYTNRI